MTQTNFSSLNLNPDLLKNLETMGYTQMTPVQAQSLPIVLAGKDIIAQAKTGSGKTAAFGLGLLNKLDVKKFRIQSLVLCPTRELADQVATEIRTLARAVHNIKVLTLCGGMPFGPQKGSLEHGAHIIVGTPGRIEDHLRKNTLNLKHCDTLVLDEADRMLDMGFEDTLNKIIKHVPEPRQTLLFSATFPEKIKSISKRVMQNPEMVKVESTHQEKTIQQHFYHIDSSQDRLRATRLLLQEYSPESTLIFCNTKVEVQRVADELSNHGFSVMALHGDLEQKDRDQTLVCFSNKTASVLVATDVAARGLDIDALDLVINYELAFDAEVHVHRVGRTGRAGNKGVACTLYADKDEYRMRVLRDYLNMEEDIQSETLPPISILDRPIEESAMLTIRIDGGKKQKVRAGDILGALTGSNGIDGKVVGKINLADNWSYVAVERDSADKALKKLKTGKLKGRNFRAWIVKSY